MAQSKKDTKEEVIAFIHEKAVQLLASSDKTNLVLQPIVCYVSKIDVTANFIEVCDGKYAVKCAFESEQARSSLKGYVKRQPEDINILGLLGKQILIEEAQLRFAIKSKNNQLKHKLRV